METFSLSDSGWLGRFHDKQSEYEAYKTRLLRVDLLAGRGSKDLIQQGFRKWLRMFWFFIRTRKRASTCVGSEQNSSEVEAKLRASYQDTSKIAEFCARFMFAAMAGASLIIPLIFLVTQTGKEAHIITVAVFIVIFSLLLSLLFKASTQEIMTASAAYAAVLVVFISNNGTAKA